MDKVYVLHLSSIHKYSPDRAVIVVRANSAKEAVELSDNLISNLGFNVVLIEEVEDKPILAISCYE